MKTEIVNFKNAIQTESNLELAYLCCKGYARKLVFNVLNFDSNTIQDYFDAIGACRILFTFNQVELARELNYKIGRKLVESNPEFTNWFIIVASSLEWPIVTIQPNECVKGQDAVIEEYRTHADFEGIIEVSWYRKPIGNESIDQDLCNETIILKKHLFDFIDEQHPGEQPASMDEDLTEYIAEYIKSGELIYTE
jgi:hypothetical protein